MQNFKIIEKKENLLFNRREIFFEVKADITPSRLETLKFFSKKFSAPTENIKIKGINGRFGSNVFSGSVFIYNSEEDKNRVEIKKKKDKKIKEELSKPKEKLEDSDEKKETKEKPEKPKEEQKSENKSTDNTKGKQVETKN